MSTTSDQDFAERVREYAEALLLGELYREPGEAIDELGEPLRFDAQSSRICECGVRKPSTEPFCFMCRNPERVAAMLSPAAPAEEAPQPRPLWRKEW